MKREILFRGKRVDNNEWVYGCFGYNTEYKESIIIYVKDNHRCTHVVHKESIGQFTGLTDKNGNKIFEGDVLNYDNIEGIVNFKDGSFFVRFEYLRSLHLLGELERDLEIIGNIHK